MVVPHQTHRTGALLGIDVLRHVLILLDSNRSGIKPGALQLGATARLVCRLFSKSCTFPDSRHASVTKLDQ